LRGKFTCHLRTGRGQHFDLRTGVTEDTYSSVEACATVPFQPAGEWIEYDSDTMG
jgi:hypothetical protein